MNRNKFGEFTSKNWFKSLSFGEKAGVIAITTVLLIGAIRIAEVSNTEVYAQEPKVEIATFEQYLEAETEKEMKSESFQKKMREQAKLNVIYRVSDDIQTRLYDEAEAIKARTQ